jgi:transmembrane sensor
LSEKSKHIDYLIARTIAGEASDAEKLELNQWINGNEANRKYFEGICFVDQKAVASNRLLKVDVDSAWQKVQNQMRAEKLVDSKPKNAKVIALPIWIRVAAIVVLVSGFALLLYQQMNPAEPFLYETVAVAPTDEIIHYLLPDSSVITLNRNSQIASASDYGKKERRVKLEGEAFFLVKHDEEKPFIVETGEARVRVTGTSFNIKNDEADSLVEVYVKTGSVLFFTASNEGINLVAGESGIFNKNRNTFTKTGSSDPNLTAYASRMFVFYNTPLNEVIRQLSRVYEVDIVLNHSQIQSCTITVSFDNDDINTVLNIIAETLGLKLRVEDNRFVFEGEGCTVIENMP